MAGLRIGEILRCLLISCDAPADTDQKIAMAGLRIGEILRRLLIS